MPSRFVHLHTHSEYSLVDSTIRVKALVESCARADMPAVALTDDSNLFALVKFYRAAYAAGVKPVAGCDLWVTEADDPRPWRLTLLCQHEQGYRNLCRLVSRAWLEGQHGGRAMIESSWLQQAGEGLIAVAGRESLFARHSASGGPDAARDALDRMRALFDERLYLELTRTRRDDEPAWNQSALHLAGALDLPVIASNDVRFLRREDFEAHEARVCIRQGRVLADPRRPREYSEEQYLKPPEDMEALFEDVPEALENTLELAKRCNLELSFGTYYLPAFPVPEGHDLDSFIRAEARTGLDQRLQTHPLAPGHTREDYDARLERELDVIISMGFPGYFLIVADFIQWGKDHDIPVGPGRGSGAGSLVAWALKITDLDPLPYDLLFERFLNPERVSMPDFDIDFCMDRRDEVIDYVARKYGRDKVSQIITYGTMAAKAVVRDSGRVLGMGYGHVDGIAKLIPNTLGISLDDALGRSEKSKSNADLVSTELIQRYENEDEVRELIDLALKLEDLTRNAGKHAGGVVIAPTPLTDFSPLYAEEGGGGVVTQFDKNDVEDVGLVKFDFLGLRTLTIIDWAVKAINARRAAAGEDALDLTQLPLDDPETYALFARGDTVAVFQFESRGMRELLKRAQPDTFEDIIALAALFRPGPLGSGMDRDWTDRKHGLAEVSYPHPSLEPVLKPTYGVIVYQEQVMQIAQVLAGYSLGGADLLRRAMGKKKPEEMAKQRAIFEEGAAKNGIDAQVATSIFDLMEKFAEYGFNKSHSAAYALVAYQTAWLKRHYPAEFMAATLSSDMDNTDKVVNFLDECKAIGLTVLPPDVNASVYKFEAVEPRVVRYGIGAIKGVGEGICQAIVAEREQGGRYTDLADFCRRVAPGKLNKRVLEALTLSGALDALAPTRASLMLQLPEAMKAAEQHLRNLDAGQHDIFGGGGGGASVVEVELKEAPEWPLEQLLSGERDTLGHYLSGHPTDPWKSVLEQLATCPLEEIPERYQPAPSFGGGEDGGNRYRRGKGTPWVVAGIVTAVRRRGETAAFVRLEDAGGAVELSFFREALNEFAPLLVRDALLVVEGDLSIDDFSGGYQVRARQVWGLNDACERLARLLRVRVNGIDANFVTHLKDALGDYRGGPTPLVLSGYRNGIGQADIELGREWRVRAQPDLLRSLRALPGVLDAELRLSRPSPGGS
ncbi:DNA polymerase III subunit alpha [Oleiagrimonas soli]|uniref:DNA polymerase III subunit alpha n=1 Tax=Oleiagrimonas soli TaxID=1543381 RepID=A0A099CV14_9GAMM|nr:DNA polymerase III subunit alpha [Oleiagrimonas soli]KGI77798.1 DNA polymerase III subunit alpha [Oleiagrimonas soli]MBB6183870.1 DNA polymerase-3 subunit alpha [Oleiagrimonas soli]